MLQFSKTQPDTISEIWKQFVDGDDWSFRNLIFIHYNSLYDYGTRFAEDQETVKDAIQDLFLILWNKRKTINQPENIKAYLFASLRRIIHKKKSGMLKMLQTQNDASTHFHLQVSIEPQYIKEESTKILVKKMASVIEKLPARQKEVIFLKFYGGFNRNEIAQAMDITPQTVSNLQQIALNKMRADLGQSFDFNILYLIVPLFFQDLL